MGYQLFNIFWESCDTPGKERIKRLADINTDTKIGGGHYTNNDPTYTLINIHGPTAGWMVGAFVILALIAALFLFLYNRRQKKLKAIVARHRALHWDAIGMTSSKSLSTTPHYSPTAGYHKNECNKIDHTKACDCKPTHGNCVRRASNGGDVEEAHRGRHYIF